MRRPASDRCRSGPTRPYPRARSRCPTKTPPVRHRETAAARSRAIETRERHDAHGWRWRRGPRPEQPARRSDDDEPRRHRRGHGHETPGLSASGDGSRQASRIGLFLHLLQFETDVTNLVPPVRLLAKTPQNQALESRGSPGTAAVGALGCAWITAASVSARSRPRRAAHPWPSRRASSRS